MAPILILLLSIILIVIGVTCLVLNMYKTTPGKITPGDACLVTSDCPTSLGCYDNRCLIPKQGSCFADLNACRPGTICINGECMEFTPIESSYSPPPSTVSSPSTTPICEDLPSVTYTKRKLGMVDPIINSESDEYTYETSSPVSLPAPIFSHSEGPYVDPLVDPNLFDEPFDILLDESHTNVLKSASPVPKSVNVKTHYGWGNACVMEDNIVDGFIHDKHVYYIVKGESKMKEIKVTVNGPNWCEPVGPGYEFIHGQSKLQLDGHVELLIRGPHGGVMKTPDIYVISEGIIYYGEFTPGVFTVQVEPCDVTGDYEVYVTKDGKQYKTLSTHNGSLQITMADKYEYLKGSKDSNVVFAGPKDFEMSLDGYLTINDLNSDVYTFKGRHYHNQRIFQYGSHVLRIGHQ